VPTGRHRWISVVPNGSPVTLAADVCRDCGAFRVSQMQRGGGWTVVGYHRELGVCLEPAAAFEWAMDAFRSDRLLEAAPRCSPSCQQRDRDAIVRKGRAPTKCGYPLPCPHHSVVVDVTPAAAGEVLGQIAKKLRKARVRT